MRRQDFSYHLPKQLIASEPTANRRDSRLLCLDGLSGAIEHGQFAQIEQLLNPGDLLVMNDTRVIPARLFAQKPTGGQVEVLVERLLEGHQALVHMRSSRSPKPGSVVILQDGSELAVTGRRDALFEVTFPADKTVLQRLNDIGHMPLPPYIEREDTAADLERYQTVYSREDKAGAVAAPTAGLHFDQAMIDALKAKGVEQAFVTLHVGAGTFQPVKAEDVTEHKMHAEWIEVTPDVVEQVRATKARGGRVIAVGTTSVRCLETASKSGAIEPVTGDTDIFIYPGYHYKTVDALITNFHLPESTLIMLVSAFAGYQHTLAAYRAAVAAQYRFFSYGDAMFITHNPAAPAETILGAQE